MGQINQVIIQAGTNVLHGGDAGYGSRTFLRITDLRGTCMDAEVKRNSFGDTEEVVISLGGDAELHTFITALKFAVRVFEEEDGPVQAKYPVQPLPRRLRRA